MLIKKGMFIMGGLMILFGVFVVVLFWFDLINFYVWVVIGVMFGFGMIGFYDDYLKVIKFFDKGFGGKVCFGFEFLIVGVVVYVVMVFGSMDFFMVLIFLFLKDFILNLGLFFILFVVFVMVGVGNVVNLIDGFDGFVIVFVMIVCVFFGLIVYFFGNVVFVNYF